MGKVKETLLHKQERETVASQPPAEGTPNQLPEMVRFHRKKSGLSQTELARLAGVGKTVVYDIEKGKQTVQLDTLLKVVATLNIRLSFRSPIMEVFIRTLHEKS